MPPTNSIDHAYAAGIDSFAHALGYKAAFEIMEREFDKASDAFNRQVGHLDGGFYKELVALVEEYPNWNVRFFNTKTGPAANISARDDKQTQGEKPEIEEKIRALYARYNKLPGLPGVVGALRLTDEKPGD
jgi:hypothetical protein